MPKLKYMGVADVKVIYKGDTAGGQLADPLPVDLVWDVSNHWVVDSDDEKFSKVPQEWWDWLLENQADLRNVSGYKRLPLNAHQRVVWGLKDARTLTAAEEEELVAFHSRGAVATKVEELLAKEAQGAKLKKSDLVDLAKEAGLRTAHMTADEVTDALRDFADGHRREAAARVANDAGGQLASAGTVGSTAGAGPAPVGGSTAGTAAS